MAKVTVLSDPAKDLAEVRSALLAVVLELTPANWFESPTIIATLDRAKLALAPRQRARLVGWLAKRR